MPKPLTEEEARQLVQDRGIRDARRLFSATLDPTLIDAIVESSIRAADEFNRELRNARTSTGRSHTLPKRQ